MRRRPSFHLALTELPHCMAQTDGRQMPTGVGGAVVCLTPGSYPPAEPRGPLRSAASLCWVFLVQPRRTLCQEERQSPGAAFRARQPEDGASWAAVCAAGSCLRNKELCVHGVLLCCCMCMHAVLEQEMGSAAGSQTLAEVDTAPTVARKLRVEMCMCGIRRWEREN